MWPLSNDLFRLLHQRIFLLIAKNFIIFDETNRFKGWCIAPCRIILGVWRPGVFLMQVIWRPRNASHQCQARIIGRHKIFVSILIHLTGGPKPAALSDQEQLVSTKFVTAKLAMASICTESQISFAKFRFLNCCMDAFENDKVWFLFFSSAEGSTDSRITTSSSTIANSCFGTILPQKFKLKIFKD